MYKGWRGQGEKQIILNMDKDFRWSQVGLPLIPLLGVGFGGVVQMVFVNAHNGLGCHR